ncbi:kelch-type beta propeller domain containing protein [Rhodotorula toruloides]|uniref:Kelch-type beta propeller domain containing protein n=1 Tax=Rhodotorula toruloides TaxID=5286 RepID=A0A511KM23_RHOTO|nr:kelch-type beta propeller domain containing protein [Rhodotorula toruloides]
MGAHKRTGMRRTVALSLALAALAPSDVAASFFASLDALRSRALVLPRQAAGGVVAGVVYSNTSVTQPTVVSATTEGRYGHVAVYLPPPTNQLLLIGGQVGENGTQITNEVLRFYVGSTFLWGDRPVSAIPDNPAKDDSLATGLPATAWTAAAATSGTSGQETWLVGGMTASCETDGLVHTLKGSSSPWSTPSLSPRVPPRRRQAKAVPISNSTTGGTDVWVLGGIAEQYTCSGETIGYVGLDRFDTVNDVVESMPWSAPEGMAARSSWEPPVSDYTATLLPGGESFVVVGGQTSEGTLTDMTSVLVFNTTSRSWTQQAVTGTAPSPRMGHVAVVLASGSILIHGGVSMTHSPLSDLFLLEPSTAGTWTWTQVLVSDHSMTSPSLAWHTANLVEGGTIIVAFGIDASSAAPSNAFWFLTVNEASGTYTWKDTFDGNQAALSSSTASATSMASKLARRKPVEYIYNPKASTESPVSAQTPTSAWTRGDSGVQRGGQSPTSAAAVASAYPPPAAKSSSSSSASLAKSPSRAAATKPATFSSDNPSSSSSTIIGASIGAIGGAVALAGLAFFVLRRRAASQLTAPSTPMMGYSSGGTTADRGAPFVSQLMYTRPSQKRNMSLGSTVTALSPHPDSIPPQSPVQIIPEEAGENLAGLGARGLGAEADPFADTYRVNEVGQLERSSSQASGASSTKGVVGAASMPSKSSPLKASVQSIPFLSSISGGSASTDNDVYTSPAPTLSAKRSLRRPSQNLPPLPVPGTPAELIGVAITSDDGHNDPSGLPHLSSSASAPQTSWDPAQDIRPVTPAMGRKSVDGAKAGDLPSSLRPGTPLRVVNPDPFVDQ